MIRAGRVRRSRRGDDGPPRGPRPADHDHLAIQGLQVTLPRPGVPRRGCAASWAATRSTPRCSATSTSRRCASTSRPTSGSTASSPRPARSPTSCRAEPRRTGTCARVPSTGLESLKDRVLGCLEPRAPRRRGARWTHHWVDPPYAEMVDDSAELLERYRRHAEAIGRSFPAPGDGPRSWAAPTWATSATWCPASTRCSPWRRPGVSIHTPEFAAHARGAAGDRAVRRRRQGHGCDGRSTAGPGRSGPSPAPSTAAPSLGAVSTPVCDLCERGVHRRGARHPPAVLHQPRRTRVRAGEPARGGQGRPVRPLLAFREVAATAVPGRVRR